MSHIIAFDLMVNMKKSSLVMRQFAQFIGVELYSLSMLGTWIPKCIEM